MPWISQFIDAEPQTVLAFVIFILTFVVLAIGRLPGLRIDRAGAALIGATLMVAIGALTMDEAWRAINSDTILLLLGMMIVVANLRLAGFFRWTAARVIRFTHSPLVLLASVVFVTGVLSAFFVNDTICLIVTPLIVEVTVALKRNPVPYLIAVATASNIGSACTITGNPQNMIIGAISKIPYAEFSAALAPVSVVGLMIAIAVIAIVYRDEFKSSVHVDVPERRVRVNQAMLWKSVLVAGAMIGFFFAGWPVSEVALVAGAVLLITRRVKPERVYHEIDFPLLVMFAGLFIVVAAIEKTTFADQLFAFGERMKLDRIPVLTALAVLLSNLVSNVPAVLFFKPVIPHLADPTRGWLTLAMATTLAGNTTLIASVANLIVVQRARPEVNITFWEYLKAGLPITVLTILFGCLWFTFLR